MTESSYSPKFVTTPLLRHVKGSIRFDRSTVHERKIDMVGRIHDIDNEEKVAVGSGSQEGVVQEEYLQVADPDDCRAFLAKRRKAYVRGGRTRRGREHLRGLRDGEMPRLLRDWSRLALGASRGGLGSALYDTILTGSSGLEA